MEDEDEEEVEEAGVVVAGWEASCPVRREGRVGGTAVGVLSERDPG